MEVQWTVFFVMKKKMHFYDAAPCLSCACVHAKRAPAHARMLTKELIVAYLGERAENLGLEGETANLQKYCHLGRNIDNTTRHGQQDTIKIVDSISQPSYDKYKEESGHHLQQHGPSVQRVVYMSKS